MASSVWPRSSPSEFSTKTSITGKFTCRSWKRWESSVPRCVIVYLIAKARSTAPQVSLYGDGFLFDTCRARCPRTNHIHLEWIPSDPVDQLVLAQRVGA